MKLTIHEVSWHRNGVGGEGFYAVHFMDHENTGKNNKDAEMLGIVFDSPGQCAVVQLNQRGPFTVRFGVNSWRGDQYEPQLRQGIKEKESKGSVRAGLLGIPVDN